MKRAIAILLAVLTAVGLSALAPVSAGAATPAWKTAYVNYIDEVGGYKESRFWLIDFDNNGIPELVYDSGYHMGGGTLSTYTGSGMMTLRRTWMGFKRSGNRLYNTTGSQGVYGDLVIKVDGDHTGYAFEGVKTAINWRDFDMNDPYDFTYRYKLNGASDYTDVSYSEYISKLRASFNFNNCVEYTTDSAMTTSRAKTAVWNYVSQPAAPTVRLSNKTNGIRSEWNKVDGAVKYVVYFRKYGASGWSSAQTGNTYYPLLDLTPGAGYQVQVQALASGNVKGKYSAVKTLIYVPQLKPAVKLSNKSNGIRAEWQSISGATKYIVYFKPEGASKWSSAETVNNYYPLLKLSAGAKYAVQVQPVFAGTKGLYSAVARLVYIPQVKPVVKLSNKSNGIRAEWNAVSGATKYIVYYKKTDNANWSSAQTSNTYYPLLNLSANTSYSVQVQPLFGSSKGLYSKVVSLTYTSADNRPLVILTKNGSELDVTWQVINGATNYIMYYKIDNNSWSQFNTAYTKVTMSGMVEGHSYSFQVQPVFGSTKGGYSRVATIWY